jgi:hypothetical protein
MLALGSASLKVVKWIPYDAIFTRSNSNSVDACTGRVERVAVQQSDTRRSHISVTSVQLRIKIVRLEPICLCKGARAGIHSKSCYYLFEGAGVHLAVVRCRAFIDTSANSISGWESKSMVLEGFGVKHTQLRSKHYFHSPRGPFHLARCLLSHPFASSSCLVPMGHLFAVCVRMCFQ